jgi:hypothetical protein
MPLTRRLFRGLDAPQWLNKIAAYFRGEFSRPPFRGLNARQWLNLLWAALFAFYITFAVMYVRTGGICDYMGADYRAFYASAQIAHDRGFAQVYDLQTQDQYQRPLYDQCFSSPDRLPYVKVPMPYLPVFVLLFMPMLLFGYMPSYWVWIVLNLGLIVLYMFRFKKALGKENGGDILAQLLICLPIFINMLLGQVNGWLLICMGEFFLALVHGKDGPCSWEQTRPGGFLARAREVPWLHAVGRPFGRTLDFVLSIVCTRDFRAGLWLAGLVLKPQTLILLLPGLLFSRRFKALAGFATASLSIGVASIAMAGGYGLGDLILLMRHYLTGLPTNAPEAMMNWRALAINLGSFLPSPLAWGLAMAGLALTVLVALPWWFRRVDTSSPRFGLVVFGTYAATCAATWHSHMHMILPLIPLVLFLYARKQMPWWVAYTWLLGPSTIFPLVLLLKRSIAYNLFGVSVLALNLFMLGWAVWTFWRQERPPKPAGDER